MPSAGVRITGLTETVRAFKNCEEAVNELKDGMQAVARLAAETMQPMVPAATGALRRSVRGTRNKARANVTIGGARIRYGGIVNYRQGSHFIRRTDNALDSGRMVNILEKTLENATRKAGL
ncbi:MAG: hypothetical protein ACRCZD_12725 [Phycicoccus sp.]